MTSRALSPRPGAHQHQSSAAVYALLAKEVRRFMKVSVQTILAPVVSALLFLLVFAFLLEGRLEPLPGIGYAEFLVPGLVIMTLQQNAFANTSSSLTQSKITGNLIFLQLSPMRPWQWLAGYLGGGLIRGLMCAAAVWITSLPVVQVGFEHFWVSLAFAVLSCLIMGTLGLIAALYAERWDHVAAFQNFLVNPLTFLAGVFYSIHNLPPAFQTISHLNPFFYLIDGFRYGVFGQADTPLAVSLGVSVAAAIGLMVLCERLIASGWRVRN